jgi:PAS domain S-box-containing protein
MIKNMSVKEMGNDLFDKLIEVAPSAMIMIDEDGQILLANLQAERLFGYSKTELLDLKIESLVPDRFKSHHPHLRKSFFAKPQNRAMGAGRELFGKRKDATELPIEIGLNPLDIKGKTYVLASIIDISERKKSEDRFRLAVEAAPNAMIMIDTDGKIVMVNKQTENLFLYERAQLLGQQIEALVPERFRHHHPHLRSGFAKDPKIRSMGAGRDLYGRRSNGTEIPIEIGLTPVGEKPTLFVLASIIDITERKKNEQLIAAKEAALEASRIKSQFLATMSHEIRTPLNGIVGLTNLLFNMEMSEHQKEHLIGIRTSTDTLLSLINDILDLSKIEAGRMEIEITDFNVGQIISDAVSVISPAAKTKGLYLKTEIDESLPTWLKGDMAKLKQVLINLLGNATKFTDKGGITIRANKITSSNGIVFVRFEVEDTGIGILEATKGHLFEVFSQGDNSTSRKYGGTGLGLSISKKLIEIMNGEIGVNGAPSHGSCFWITLSLSEGIEIKKALKQPKSLVLRDQAKKFNVLVAEDNVINQKVALGTLKNFGIDGQVVGNGIEAIEILNRIPFDIVLMDCQMPEMDGFEATSKIRQSETPRIKSIPIVAMTANVMQGDRERCLEVGMNDYISKPIDQNDLERILLRWLPIDPDNLMPASSQSDSQVLAVSDALVKLRNTYNDGLVTDLINTFVMTTPQNLNKLEKAFQRFDFKTILMEAHTIKSTCLLLGLTDFSSLAFQVEKTCRQENKDHLEIQIPILIKGFSVAVMKLKEAAEILNLKS